MSRLEIDGLCATDAAEAVLLDVYYIYEFSHSNIYFETKETEKEAKIASLHLKTFTFSFEWSAVNSRTTESEDEEKRKLIIAYTIFVCVRDSFLHFMIFTFFYFIFVGRKLAKMELSIVWNVSSTFCCCCIFLFFLLFVSFVIHNFVLLFWLWWHIGRLLGLMERTKSGTARTAVQLLLALGEL